MVSSEASSPPSWAQTILQQLAQSSATQESFVQQFAQNSAAQDERIKRLEETIQRMSTATVNESTLAQLRTEAEAKQRQEVEVHRPRARLPDPAMFAGSTTDWPTWRITMENKLSVDGLAIGSPQEQFIYIFSRLEKLAWKNTGTYVKMRRNEGTPQELLDHLESIYGDPNSKARAARRLHQIRQREDQPFSKFLPRLEKEFADAGALEWHDEAKRQILLQSLSRNMTESLMNRGIPPTFTGLIARLHEISNDIDALCINRPQRPRSPKTSRIEATYEPMDWTPTTTVASGTTQSQTNRSRSGPRTSQNRDEHLVGKRAKWVAQDEIDRRRAEGRCLRCGRDDCRISRCPLKAAVPRKEKSRRPQVTTAAIEEPRRNTTETTTEEESSSGSENE